MTCGVLPFDKNAQITKVGERIARVSEQLANKLNETSVSALSTKKRHYFAESRSTS